MRHPVFIALLCSVLLASCGKEQNSTERKSAAEIIDQAIDAHGGDLYSRAEVSFTFRGRDYTSTRMGGEYALSRAYTDTSGEADKYVHQVLSNKGFETKVDGELVALDAKAAAAQKESVNSVHYFAMLPYGLNDPAVNKEYLGEVSIDNNTYDKVRITFDQEGGGTDFEDVFIYWFDTQSHELKYLAYQYHVNGGGIRFREAINPRRIGGILFNDYINYKADPQLHALSDTDSLFEKGALAELSRIISEDVKVAPLEKPVK